MQPKSGLSLSRADRTAIRQAGSTTGFRVLLGAPRGARVSKSIKSGVRKPQAYTGELAEPIYIPNFSRNKYELEAEATYRKIIKFHKLFEFYKIDSTGKLKWYQLALALAEQHVPGFRVVYGVRPKKGRRRTWKAGLGDDLVRDVEALTAKRKMTIEDAIKKLRTDSSKWRRYTVPNLITRDREARREQKERDRLASELKKSGLIAGLGGLTWPPSTDGK
jgi:hypothetical protein